MRTTVTFDRDVAEAIETLRRRRSLGMSEAVNELIRAGLSRKAPQPRYRQRSHALGLRIDVADVAGALERLEGPTSR